MSNFAALEVAIGLSFLYFVLSLVCSTVTEAIAAKLGWRAKTLEQGILNLLSGTDHISASGRSLAAQFWEHPLIQALSRPQKPGAAGSSRPSYIPSRTFVSALVDLGAQTHLGRKESGRPPSAKAVTSVDLLDAIEGIDNEQIRHALLTLYRDADGHVVSFRRGAEQWFDDSMERVSGWYRRHIQRVLWIAAAVLVLALNVDTIQVGRVLWTDDAARAAVTARAEKVANQGSGSLDLGGTLRSLEIPLGWNLFKLGNGPQDIPNDPVAWISKILGLLLTVAALSLGAPFWFDLLSKIVRVRSSGAPPPASDAVRIGEGEEKRAAGQP